MDLGGIFGDLEGSWVEREAGTITGAPPGLGSPFRPRGALFHVQDPVARIQEPTHIGAYSFPGFLGSTCPRPLGAQAPCQENGVLGVDEVKENKK